MNSRSGKAGPPAQGWRFRTGLSLFVLGGVSPVFVPLAAAMDISPEWKTVVSGLLVLGIPELLWLAAAAIMGKSGFDYLKGKAFGFLRRYAPADIVSPTRYRVGLALFLLPLLWGWLTPYVSGMIAVYEQHRFAMAFAGDVMLLTSLFVLGGEFWDKLRALFSHSARASFATSSGEPGAVT